jgi:hypothetical protein
MMIVEGFAGFSSCLSRETKKRKDLKEKKTRLFRVIKALTGK